MALQDCNTKKAIAYGEHFGKTIEVGRVPIYFTVTPRVAVQCLITDSK